MAAQAYSPSDAMSQARFCLDGMKKVQRRFKRICLMICALKRGPCSGRSCSRGRGGPPDFPRHRRPRCIAPCGGVVWLCVAGRRPRRDFPPRFSAVASQARRLACRPLFLARWIRLPRRNVGARRRRVRPDRLRHPGRLRGAAQAQKPCDEMDAMLRKQRRGGFVGDGNLYVHAARHSVRVLTDGSGETASTHKIVSDVTRICRWTDKR